jgi:hypothetical protein
MVGLLNEPTSHFENISDYVRQKGRTLVKLDADKN